MQRTEVQAQQSKAAEQQTHQSGIFAVPKVRNVTLDGHSYHISLRSSIQRADQRFDQERYALVEEEGQWQAVVPAPPLVRDVDLLWYRELIELIERAAIYVGMRARPGSR